MPGSIQDQLTKKTIELRDYAGKLNRNISIPFFIFLLRSDRETKNTYLQLSSKVQQILYLLRLFLNEENGNQNDIDCPRVQSLLQTIEELYKDKFTDNQTIQYYDNNYRRLLSISGTYLNFFLNSSLVYVEQIIDRIQGTFGGISSFILQETGLSVDDYIQFYLETNEINKNKFHYCYSTLLSQEIDKSEEGMTCYSEKNDLFLPYSLPLKLAIYKSDYKLIEIDKLDIMLSYFSSYPGDCNNIYYCYPNILWEKPFICLNEIQFYLSNAPQLILAIYYYLFQICERKDKEKASKARCSFLERKTMNLFDRYFKDFNPKIYTNYYLNCGNNEKDILVICKNAAFIIECKSKKYNEPFGDVELSYQRIKSDFRNSIQDAYRQVKEVEDLFYSQDEIKITDKKKNIIDEILTKKINQVFSIIVTQERFGQIQCDLGLLLKKKDNYDYPWSVSVDDLESILITFSRKENPFGMLSIYLHSREKLHERLICFDELDLAGYYLMQNREFVKNCNSNQIFIASSDVCTVFDKLYYSGFGFLNELFLDEKIRISVSSLITYELCKKLKLKTPKNIQEYKCINGISDDAMRFFKKLITSATKNSHTKELFEDIQTKSFSYKDIISIKNGL